MSLLTAEVRNALIANGKANAFSPDQQINNVPPVCMIYDEHSAATWLLTEIDRNDPDRAWGLVDAGDGQPDFEPVSISDLEGGHQTVTFSDNSKITVGTHLMPDWKAKGPISAYIAAAAKAGRIVDLDEEAVTQ